MERREDINKNIESLIADRNLEGLKKIPYRKIRRYLSRYSKYNAVGTAVIYEHPEIVEFLVEIGVDFSYRDKNNETPFSIAVRKSEYSFDYGEEREKNIKRIMLFLLEKVGDQCFIQAPKILFMIRKIYSLDLVKKLIEGPYGFVKFPLNFKLQCVIHEAVNRNDVETVRYLMSKDSNVIFIEDINSETPIDYAILQNKAKILEIMIKDNSQICKSVNYINKLYKNFSIDVAKILFEFYGKLTSKYSDYLIPKIIKTNDFNFFKFSFEGDFGLSDNIPNCFNSIIERGNIEIVEYLVMDRGIDINSNNYSTTFLNKAVDTDSYEITKMLLEAGADVSIKDKTGNKCCHHVKSIKVLELLISYGADIEALDHTGETPIYNAIRQKNYDLVNYFIESGVDTTSENRYKKSCLNVARELLRFNRTNPNLQRIVTLLENQS